MRILNSSNGETFFESRGKLYTLAFRGEDGIVTDTEGLTAVAVDPVRPMISPSEFAGRHIGVCVDGTFKRVPATGGNSEGPTWSGPRGAAIAQLGLHPDSIGVTVTDPEGATLQFFDEYAQITLRDGYEIVSELG